MRCAPDYRHTDMTGLIIGKPNNYSISTKSCGQILDGASIGACFREHTGALLRCGSAMGRAVGISALWQRDGKHSIQFYSEEAR